MDKIQEIIKESRRLRTESTSEKNVTIELDWVLTDFPADSIPEQMRLALENIVDKTGIPMPSYKITKEIGPAGGATVVKITAPRDDIRKLLDYYNSGDKEETERMMNDYLESVRKESKERLLKQVKGNDGNVVKIYKDSDTGEFICKLFKKGKHSSKSDYHTDDKNDATRTAKEMVKEGFEHSDFMADYHAKLAATEKQLKKMFPHKSDDDIAKMAEIACYSESARKHPHLRRSIRKVSVSAKRAKKEAVEKIACVNCDEVSTKAAWKKNGGFCPKCEKSSQGVAEARKLRRKKSRRRK